MFAASNRDFDGSPRLGGRSMRLDSLSDTWYIIHQSKNASLVCRVSAAIWVSVRTMVRGFGLSVPWRTPGQSL